MYSKDINRLFLHSLSLYKERPRVPIKQHGEKLLPSLVILAALFCTSVAELSLRSCRGPFVSHGRALLGLDLSTLT